MKKVFSKFVIFGCVAGLLLSGCGAAQEDDWEREHFEAYEQPQTLQVDISRLQSGKKLLARQVPAGPWKREPLEDVTQAFKYGQLDFRHRDVSGFDLTGIPAEQIEKISFDSATVWPKELPPGFDPKSIIERGKDPGLGIRTLHQQGWTGKGINIAIVDQALYQEHTEYKDRLRFYEEYLCSDPVTQMHGAAVSSIAVGKTTGVASKADLYYIASTAWSDDYDLTPIAGAIYRFIEINKQLPQDDKIRVLSISNGYIEDTKGAKEMEQAIADAKKEGIFVICMNTDMHGFDILGCGGEMTSDPNDPQSRMPAFEYRDYYWQHPDEFQRVDRLIVPQDNRTYASWTQNSEKSYEFSANGGVSWTAPWLAGFYALCLEAKPEMTIDEFVAVCLQTGETISIPHEGQAYTFGKILNPQKVVDALTA
ncbi:S8 family serine peptidase [Oscillospiraceae bacterium MB08-C2-2]|nr:S8 family serine peptidase [Oscillospiraceae bacterium MB08-C2-2]